VKPKGPFLKLGSGRTDEASPFVPNILGKKIEKSTRGFLSHLISFSHTLKYFGLYNLKGMKHIRKHHPTSYIMLDCIIWNRCEEWKKNH